MVKKIIMTEELYEFLNACFKSTDKYKNDYLMPIEEMEPEDIYQRADCDRLTVFMDAQDDYIDDTEYMNKKRAENELAMKKLREEREKR